MAIAYHTATTVNGYLADTADSLDWLFAVPPPFPDDATGSSRIVVMGSTTYRWILEHENLLAEPDKWQQLFGSRPVFVFSHRAPEMPTGANVHILSGPVADHLGELRAAAGDGDIWVQGGGDLAGQFDDAGALDEVTLAIAPVFLTAGRHLLPHTIPASRLDLVQARQVGQFIEARYRVRR